jgi:hypothetical protein
LGITRLIWIPQIPLTQVKKIKEETESQEDKNLGPFLRINIRKSSFSQFWNPFSISNILSLSTLDIFFKTKEVMELLTA